MKRLLLCAAILLHAPRRAAGDAVKCDHDATFEAGASLVKPVQFSWLGTLQYINVRSGAPHYFRQPRVVLVSRRAALAAAADAALVPDGYALGNVVFNLYERDEAECGVGLAQLAAGRRCLPALLLAPVADVLLHPEYKNFGVRHSVALLKMLRGIVSVYMLPACLPLEDYVMRYGIPTKDELYHVDFSFVYMLPACLPLEDYVMRYGIPTKDELYHVDFSFDVPRDFAEDKEVKKLTVLSSDICRVLDPENFGNGSGAARLACTAGCGLRSGSALLTHEPTGHWTLVGLSLGGTPCADPLRERRPPPPARHLLLLPYVPWITAAIGGVGASSKDDPFGYAVPLQAGADAGGQLGEWTPKRGHGWFGHWYMAGARCRDRGPAARDMRRFYYEIFRITMDSPTQFNYNLDLSSQKKDLIVCVKVGAPFQALRPAVSGVGSAAARVSVPGVNLRETYVFHVEAWSTVNKNPGSDSDSD